MQPESEMCMETVGARAGPPTCCPRLISPDTASVEQYKTQPAAERMTAPERATAFAVEDRMHGFVRTDRGPVEAPRRASTPWILGCSSDPNCLGCIRMHSGPRGKPDVRIDEARGCWMTNIAPWTHTSVSHGVRCIRMQPQRTETKWIDDAGGCRLGCRHRSPGSHVGVDATVGAVPEGKPMLTSVLPHGPVVAPTVWVGIGMPSRICIYHWNAGIRTHLTAVRFQRTGSANVFENGTSDASAGRNADAAAHSDVLEMKVTV